MAGAGLRGSAGLGINTSGLGNIDRGPLTGPAHLANENVFEKSFLLPEDDLQAQSPNSISSPDPITEEPEEEEVESARTRSPAPVETAQPPQVADSRSPHKSDSSNNNSADLTPSQTERPQRSSLKRTYTDIAGYSLQHKLTEALAQPYHATNSPLSAVSTTNAPTFRPPQPARAGTTVNERAPHGVRNNQAQAIFTTERIQSLDDNGSERLGMLSLWCNES